MMPTTSLLRRIAASSASTSHCAGRSLSIPRPGVPFACRQLHSTRSARASEVPRDPLADPELQSIYEKIRNHQGAVDAMMSVGKLMKEKGINTSEPLSRLQLLKLSMDGEIREAGLRLVEELKAAGVELTPETVQMMVRKMGSVWPPREE